MELEKITKEEELLNNGFKRVHLEITDLMTYEKENLRAVYILESGKHKLIGSYEPKIP